MGQSIQSQKANPNEYSALVQDQYGNILMGYVVNVKVTIRQPRQYRKDDKTLVFESGQWFALRVVATIEDKTLRVYRPKLSWVRLKTAPVLRKLRYVVNPSLFLFETRRERGEWSLSAIEKAVREWARENAAPKDRGEYRPMFEPLPKPGPINPPEPQNIDWARVYLQDIVRLHRRMRTILEAALLVLHKSKSLVWVEAGLVHHLIMACNEQNEAVPIMRVPPIPYWERERLNEVLYALYRWHYERRVNVD